MPRRGETKDAARPKARALPREGRQKSQEGPKRPAQEGVKQGRAKAASPKAARTKPGGAKSGRAKAARARPGGAKSGRAKGAQAKPAKTADGGADANVESRLARLEEALALQAERSDELLEKVEAVLAKSNPPGAGGAGAST